MIKPSLEVYRAFFNLQESHEPNFKVILQWMRDCLKFEEAGYSRIIDDVQLRMCQGRHQCLSIIIESNDSSRDILKAKK
jgi:hypothetical protein